MRLASDEALGAEGAAREIDTLVCCPSPEAAGLQSDALVQMVAAQVGGPMVSGRKPFSAAAFRTARRGMDRRGRDVLL